MILVVDGQRIYNYEYQEPLPIATNSLGFLDIEFRLSEEWDGYICTAQFVQHKENGTDFVASKVLYNNHVTFPDGIVPGVLEISLFGYKAGEAERGTTFPYIQPVYRSGFTSTEATPIPPTPDLYSQFLESFETTKQSIENDKQTVQNASKDAITAKDYAVEAAKTAVAVAEAAQSYLNSIKPNTEQAIAGIQTEGNTQRSSVTSTGDAQNQRIMDTGAEQSRALSAQGDVEQRKVIAAGDEQVSRVTNAGNGAVESVTLEKTNAINDVQSTKTDAVNSVESAKTIAVEAVKSAESVAIQNIGTGVDDTLSISGKAADAKKTGDSISSLKSDLADCKLSESNLYTEISDDFDYGDFTFGKPNNPSESINTSVTYVGTIYANLKKGMVVKSLSTEYDYTVAKVSDNKFVGWKAKGNDTVIEEEATYVICVRSNIYAPFSTVVQDVKRNFKIQSIYHTLKYVDEYRFNVKEYGAVGDGTTGDSFAIQKVLDIAKTEGNVCVYFPKGTYYIESTLQYYPNTEIIMHPEAIILRDEKVSPILTNSPICGDDVPCYSNGYLRLNGGTFKGVYPSGNTVYRLICLQCGKLSELTIENVSFIDACAGNHLLDISGCNNVTIRHNKIIGMHLQQSLRPTTPNGDEGHVAALEMIQLDVGKGLGVGVNPPYDLIPTKNVVIEDNEFMANPDNAESVLYRPIGIHMNPYDGYYYENIRINDNSFKDILGRCIGISGVRLVEICRNTFESELPMVDDLIKLSMFMGTLARDSHNINIEDNKATMQSDTYNFFAVYTGGSTAKYMSNLRIVQNYAPNLAITLENTKNSYLMLNTVSNVDYSIRCEGIIENETFDKGSAISNPLYGRKIGALGDSLTYGHTLGTDKVWVAKIAERNGMIAYNYGQNGNPLASTENVQGMVERYAAMVDGLDYITVEGGANDMNEGIPIGTNTDTSIYTFKGAINTLIDGLRAKYPTAHIIFMTNWKRGYSGELTYVEAMKEVCALKGIPCKDNYHTSGIDFTDTNQSQYFDLGIVDGGSANKHFSEAGNEFISWGIEAFLKSC